MISYEGVKKMFSYLMTLRMNVSLKLVKRVGVVVACVASELGWVSACQHIQLPLICWSTFPYVIEQR